MSLCINPSCTKPLNPESYLFCQACGSELLLAGKYRVMRLLSEKGGFANTYEVLEKDQLKVLKVLTNNHPHARELFQEEARVLSKLNYPGIPKGEASFTYFPRDSQTPLHCLVMEKIEGMDLEEYQQQRQHHPIDQKLALAWLIQLASILHEVHRHNFFHRDIKPSNIILQPNGQLVLIDFGAVRQVTATILAGGQNTGIYTPGYAPPEQEKGYAVQQSDFFALGRTFVYLLTGKQPTDPAIYDHYNNELSWRKYAPKINENLANFIDELMAEKANQRPANTAIILQKLSEINRQLYPKEALANQSQAKTIVLSEYAGFWLRLKAALIDNIIVAILAASLGGFISFQLYQKGIFQYLNFDFAFHKQEFFVYSSALSAFGTTIFGLLLTLLIVILWIIYPADFSQEVEGYLFLLAWLILGIFCKWFYFVILEFSWLRATLGKILMGIIVTDFQGNRISFKKANQRYWSKLLSVMTLYIGFMLAGWTKRKRSLHDIVTGTLVKKGKHSAISRQP
jgi:serine/threonine protein kinase